MILHLLRVFGKDESGATAIEYGMIAALISMAVAVSIFAFGDTLRTLFFDRLADIIS